MNQDNFAELSALTHHQDCLFSSVSNPMHQDGCPSCADKLHPTVLLEPVARKLSLTKHTNG